MGLIAVCFFAVWKNYDGPHLSVRNVGRGFTQVFTSGSSTDDFNDALVGARRSFEESADDLHAGQLNRLPALQKGVAKSIDDLRKAPSLSVTSDQLMGDLLKVMQDQYELIGEVQRAGTVTFGSEQHLKQNVDQYNEVIKRFKDWIRTVNSAQH
jgi:hypothetical protein